VYFISPEPTDNGVETDRIFAYKFSPTSKGVPIWQQLLDNQILEPEGGTNSGGGMKERWAQSSPAFSLQETSLYALVGNTINRVDTATGKLDWSMKPAGATGSFKSSPVVDDKDNLYVGTKSNTDSVFYAIRADGTGILWKITLGADMYPTPLLGDDGNVYFGSETSQHGRFHVADRLTGQLRWNLDKMSDLSFGSPILYNGFIYLGIFQNNNGADSLFKIKADAKGYLPGAAWPRFHGGNANTGRREP
jgi:outer membrane protein assembly factor BamB